jgi:hypothetical protein
VGDRHEFPAQFALRLMHKDFGLIAAQLNAAEQAKGEEEDFSAVGRLMLELSGARTNGAAPPARAG